MASATRYVIDYDHDYEHEESDGGPMPMTEERYKGHEYYKDGQPIPHAEYLTYYGDPDRHVVVWMRRTDQCPCCQTWISGDSLGGIDLMDDQPEAGFIGTFTLDQLPGYLREVAADLEPHSAIVDMEHLEARHDPTV